MNSKNKYAIAPVPKTRLREEIVSRLTGAIVAGEIGPGTRLPPERALAESFGVNRSTLREALNKLESMELVEVRHGDGVYAMDPGDSGSLDLVRWMLDEMDGAEAEVLMDLMDLRAVIIPEIAARAALRRSEKDLAALERAAIGSDHLSVGERDRLVHNAVARAGGNRLYLILLNAFTKLAAERVSAYFDDPENCARSVKFHRSLYNAIERGDARSARRVMKDALVYAREAAVRLLEDGE